MENLLNNPKTNVYRLENDSLTNKYTEIKDEKDLI
jgi:hypothetical protein